MDKTLHMSLLYDTYGQLLTERQKRFFSLYYEDDLSLGEIATQHGISRQAVYDILKRSQKALCEFEKHMQLVARDEKLHPVLAKLHANMGELHALVLDMPEPKKNAIMQCLAEINDNLTILCDAVEDTERV